MVCSPVGNLPISTPVPVHEQINNFMTSSTGTSTSTGVFQIIFQKVPSKLMILVQTKWREGPFRKYLIT